MGDFKRKLFSWKWKEQKVVTLLLEIKKKGDILLIDYSVSELPVPIHVFKIMVKKE